MRTNIDIDDDLMARALAAGPYKTKKEVVEAGLRLLERQAAARELLKLEGKLPWGWGDEERLRGQPNWSHSPAEPAAVIPATAKPVKAAAKATSRAKPTEARLGRR